mmetsp:Transcript_48547/g.96781  ORF Transcript_48547/g.96781 Transcript_48547/m.96781 type:complete len:248 (+) Transcript_48547:306-1049(+)
MHHPAGCARPNSSTRMGKSLASKASDGMMWQRHCSTWVRAVYCTRGSRLCERILRSASRLHAIGLSPSRVHLRLISQRRAQEACTMFHQSLASHSCCVGSGSLARRGQVDGVGKRDVTLLTRQVTRCQPTAINVHECGQASEGLDLAAVSHHSEQRQRRRGVALGRRMVEREAAVARAPVNTCAANAIRQSFDGSGVAPLSGKMQCSLVPNVGHLWIGTERPQKAHALSPSVRCSVVQRRTFKHLVI